MVRPLLLLALCLLSAPAFADSWKVGGVAVPDTAWAKADGGFGAQLVFTDEPEALFAAWEAGPAPGVSMSEAASTLRGKPIVGVVFFTGCGADADGLCDATVTYTIRGPDGAAYGDVQAGELWRGKPRPDPGQLQLGVDVVGVVIEPADKLGAYTVRAEVADRVTSRTLVLERAFTAVATPGEMRNGEGGDQGKVAMVSLSYSPGVAGNPAALDGLQQRYSATILDVIQASWNPVRAPIGVGCTIQFVQIPGGEVIRVEFLACPYDEPARADVERALARRPLPYAGFESVFSSRIRLTLKRKPPGIHGAESVDNVPVAPDKP